MIPLIFEKGVPMLRALWKGKLGHRLKDRNKKLESAAVWEVSTVVCYLRLVCFDVLSALVTQFTKYVRIRVSRQEKNQVSSMTRESTVTFRNPCEG